MSNDDGVVKNLAELGQGGQAPSAAKKINQHPVRKNVTPVTMGF